MNPTRARAKMLAAFEQGDWPRVEFRAEEVLAGTPDDAAAHYMLGRACLARNQGDRAVEALGEACRLEPGKPEYLARHAQALGMARRAQEACAAADRAMARSPDDATVLATLGHVYVEAHAIESGAAALRRAVAYAPGRADMRFELGRALEMLGDYAGAERELEACIRLDPRWWPAHLRLSMLQRQTVSTQHRARLRSLLDQHADDPGAQIFLNMALARESEDLGEYAPAFQHFALAKSAARGTRPSPAARDAAMFDAIKRCFPDVENRPDAGFRSSEPIFIVGMPRSGTTLLDRMLSNHPEVYAAGELQNFATALQRASGSGIALLSLPDIGAATAHIDWHRLGTTYIDSTRPATAVKPHFVDKLPHNFLYAGFIARALPNARIVCLRRDPLDTCLGNFRHLFEWESGFYDYSLDLLDIGRYFIQFDRLLAHWRRVLPGRILEVDYEALVREAEPTLRRVLAFCGLPWDAACLRPQANTAALRTPNSWQARSPVYVDAIGRWRRYARQLQPLREMLGPAGIELRDSDPASWPDPWKS
ncbi:MAG: sulfotransferase [Rhodanobacteraceae bacterium]